MAFISGRPSLKGLDFAQHTQENLFFTLAVGVLCWTTYYMSCIPKAQHAEKMVSN